MFQLQFLGLKLQISMGKPLIWESVETRSCSFQPMLVNITRPARKFLKATNKSLSLPTGLKLPIENMPSDGSHQKKLKPPDLDGPVVSALPKPSESQPCPVASSTFLVSQGSPTKFNLSCCPAPAQHSTWEGFWPVPSKDEGDPVAGRVNQGAVLC